MFSHQFAPPHRPPGDQAALALEPRVEQQQQKVDQLADARRRRRPLETTIGYEQVAVDLTAWLARARAGSVPEAGAGLRAAGGLRPPLPLRQPLRDDRGRAGRGADRQPDRDHAGAADRSSTTATRRRRSRHYDTHTVDPLSRLHVMTIMAAEQQTMNFYMNHGPDYMEPIARGALPRDRDDRGAARDATTSRCSTRSTRGSSSWSSTSTTSATCTARSCSRRPTARIKAIWELHLDMEIGQLQVACDLLRRYDGRDPRDAAAGLPETPSRSSPTRSTCAACSPPNRPDVRRRRLHHRQAKAIRGVPADGAW